MFPPKATLICLLLALSALLLLLPTSVAQEIVGVKCLKVFPLKGVCRLEIIVRGCEKVWVKSLEVDGISLSPANVPAKTVRKEGETLAVVLVGATFSKRSHLSLALACGAKGKETVLRLEGVVGELVGEPVESSTTKPKQLPTAHASTTAYKTFTTVTPPVLKLTLSRSAGWKAAQTPHAEGLEDLPLYIVLVASAAITYLVARRQA